MKRCILITRLTVEATGWRRYTVKVCLRDGMNYRMNTHSKVLYNCLNTELAKPWNEVNQAFILQVAEKVLECNDVFYDEVELL